MKRTFAVVFCVITMFLGSTVNAAMIIDFGTGNAGSGGSVTYADGNYIGNDILIGVVTGLFTPISGNWVTYAVLDFNTSSDTLSITGTIPDLGITTSQELLSGTLTSFSAHLEGDILDIDAAGFDTKSESLLDALGINYDGLWVFQGWTLSARQSSTDNVFTAYSTDISNTPVPEPATMLLLGTGLLGLAVISRRKFKK